MATGRQPIGNSIAQRDTFAALLIHSVDRKVLPFAPNETNAGECLDRVMGLKLADKLKQWSPDAISSFEKLYELKIKLDKNEYKGAPEDRVKGIAKDEANFYLQCACFLKETKSFDDPEQATRFLGSIEKFPGVIQSTTSMARAIKAIKTEIEVYSPEFSALLKQQGMSVLSSPNVTVGSPYAGRPTEPAAQSAAKTGAYASTSSVPAPSAYQPAPAAAAPNVPVARSPSPANAGKQVSGENVYAQIKLGPPPPDYINIPVAKSEPAATSEYGKLELAPKGVAPAARPATPTNSPAPGRPANTTYVDIPVAKSEPAATSEYGKLELAPKGVAPAVRPATPTNSPAPGGSRSGTANILARMNNSDPNLLKTIAKSLAEQAKSATGSAPSSPQIPPRSQTPAARGRADTQPVTSSPTASAPKQEEPPKPTRAVPKVPEEPGSNRGPGGIMGRR